MPPLVFLDFPLLFRLLVGEVLNQLFFLALVLCLLEVVLLELNDFAAAALTLLLFLLLQSLLTGESVVEQVLVALLLSSQLGVSEGLLSFVVSDEVQVSFSVQDELLAFSFTLVVLLSRPLVLQHVLFIVNHLLLIVSLLLASHLLPVEHTVGVFDQLLLLNCLFLFALDLFGFVQLPQLGVELLLSDFLLHLLALLNELLLALNLTVLGVELRAFLPQLISSCKN